MFSPVQKTFYSLQTSRNEHAHDVLVAALEVPDDDVRLAALAVLVNRGSVRGAISVIERQESLTQPMWDIVRANGQRMETALRQSLLHGTPDLQWQALEFVRRTDAYGQFPALLLLIAQAEGELQAHAIRIVQELANRVFSELRSGGNGSLGSTAALWSQRRQQMLLELDAALQKSESLSAINEIVETVLALGELEHPVQKRLMWNAAPRSREMAGYCLLTSRHPGVMQKIVDSMSRNYPHPKVFEAIRTREDPEFISHLLRAFPTRLSANQQRNYKQIGFTPWLAMVEKDLQQIPVALQPALARFVAATSLPRETRAAVQEWLFEHGTPEGRLAAVGCCDALDATTVRKTVLESLDAGDPSVQAWAISQLRSQRIPDAISILVERLDSPLLQVREMARRELGDFTLERALDLSEHLDLEACRRMGRLLQKTDPEAVNKLRQELYHPVRPRRTRALGAAERLGFLEQILDDVAVLLYDRETAVRRMAAEVLGNLPTAAALLALQSVAEEPSPRVREALDRSIQRLMQHLGPPDLQEAGAGLSTV